MYINEVLRYQFVHRKIITLTFETDHVQFRTMCPSVYIRMKVVYKEDMQRDAISLPSSKVMQIWNSRNNATPKKSHFHKTIYV